MPKNSDYRRREDGRIRRSQVLTTGGPGALVDLVEHAVIIKGPDNWKYESDDEGFFDEPRLAGQALAFLLQTPGWNRKYVRLRRPPSSDEDSPGPHRGMHAREFPSWYLCQRCNSLVKRDALDGRRRHTCTDDPGPKNKPVPTVPIRFVNACAKGHIQDIDWRRFVHRNEFVEEVDKPYRCLQDPKIQMSVNRDGYRYSADLMLRTAGTSGGLNDLVITCRRCGKGRGLQDLTQPKVFGTCSAWRPWLANNDDRCDQDAKLLIRTGSNAWFPIVYSVLSIPEPQRDLKQAVQRHWKSIKKATTPRKLRYLMEEFLDEEIVEELSQWEPEEICAIIAKKAAGDLDQDVPIREAEWQELMSADFGVAHDLPPRGSDWYARRLDGVELPDFIDRVVLIHALREVRAQVGFTRLESFPVGPEGTVEMEPDRVAPLSEKVDWIPTVGIRGEGVFIAFDEAKVREWEARPAVRRRQEMFREGLRKENALKASDSSMDHFTGSRLLMLHSLAHMLITAISLECGYSASAIRERIYCARYPIRPDAPAEEREQAYQASRAGILLYTGTPGSEGTLGGLVDVGRNILKHLRRAVEMNELCSNDPVCAQHVPNGQEEGRRREGAACHGCLLIAEPSCERMNRDLDRTFIVPTVEEGSEDVAFLGDWSRTSL